MAGRPTKYTQEVADKICYLISTTSKGIEAICLENADLPSFKTVFTWLKDERKDEFLQAYARAKECQADVLAQEIITIADTCRIGTKTKETKDGVFTETGDMVERSRLMVDARKWLASKLAPKKYGDKMEIDLNNKVVQVLVEPEDDA